MARCKIAPSSIRQLSPMTVSGPTSALALDAAVLADADRADDLRGRGQSRSPRPTQTCPPSRRPLDGQSGSCPPSISYCACRYCWSEPTSVQYSPSTYPNMGSSSVEYLWENILRPIVAALPAPCTRKMDGSRMYIPVLTVSEKTSPQEGFSRNRRMRPPSSVMTTPNSSGLSTCCKHQSRYRPLFPVESQRLLHVQIGQRVPGHNNKRVVFEVLLQPF